MANGKYEEKNGKDKPARKTGSVGGADDAAFRGYINLNLSEEEKTAYDTWAADDAVWVVLCDQVAAGVNVAVKRDTKGLGFMASATQRDPRSVNAGLVVTARGSSAATAFGRVLYMLAILSRAESWETTQPVANPDRW